MEYTPIWQSKYLNEIAQVFAKRNKQEITENELKEYITEHEDRYDKLNGTLLTNSKRLTRRVNELLKKHLYVEIDPRFPNSDGALIHVMAFVFADDLDPEHIEKRIADTLASCFGDAAKVISIRKLWNHRAEVNVKSAILYPIVYDAIRRQDYVL